jgi:mannosyl-3-phosphoglycerate phosphatase family protein
MTRASENEGSKNHSRIKMVIFTDLDGTLLHPKTYSFQEAASALELIREKDIPLVLCSSKTKAEMEVHRRRLKNDHPFIVENGAAVFVPRGYFPFLCSATGEDYLVTSFGKSYGEIRRSFVRLREMQHTPVKGFGDMTTEEVAVLTGLSVEEASLAQKRDFSEPFVFEKSIDEGFLNAVLEHGLHWTRGRLFCLMGDHDKGRAVRLLKQWYVLKYGAILSVGIGDGLNDLPLLREVDHPILVQKEDGGYDRGIDFPDLRRARGIGPQGWNRVLLELLK